MSSNLIVNNIEVGAGATIYTAASNQLAFGTNGSEKVRITSAGKVGIATASPATTLDVQGDMAVAYNATHALRFYTQPKNNWSSISNTATDGNANLSFKSSQGEAMFITYSKNVGIGTNNPLSVLHVREDTFTDITIHSERTSGNIGGINFRKGGVVSGIMTAQYFVDVSGNHYFHSQGSQRLKISSDGDLLITGSDNAELKLKCGTSTGNNVIAFLNSSGTTKGNIFYDSDHNFMVFKTNGTASSNERLRITSDGKIGIGIDSPQANLDVNNTDSANSGTHSFQMGSYGIRTNDTNSYNHWYIERNYGGWQATPQVVLKASGHTGFNIVNPTKVIHGEDSSATETNVLALRNYKSSVNTKPTLVFEASSSAGQGANSSIQGLAGTDAGGAANANDSGMKFIVRHGGSGTEREAFTIKKDGNIYFPSGQGIDFSATSDHGGMVSEVLDDYEEGSFTMFFWCSSTNYSTQPTMTTNNCRYTKIGNKVTFTAYLSWGNQAAGGSGNLYLGGLPYSVNNYQSYGAVYFGWFNISSGFAAHEYPVGYINNNSGNIVLMRQAIGAGGGRSYATLACSALHGGTGTFQLSGTYLTNS